MFCFCSAFPPAQLALLGSPVWEEEGKVREREEHRFWGLNPGSVFLTPMSLKCPTCVRAGDTVTISKKGDVYWSLGAKCYCHPYSQTGRRRPRACSMGEHPARGRKQKEWGL